MNDMNDSMLSAQGIEKRDAILHTAAAAMARHHRMRRRKRVIASSAMFLLIAGGAIVVNQFALRSSSMSMNQAARHESTATGEATDVSPPEDGGAVEWRIVRSDSTALSRYAVSNAAPVERLSDAGLARMLESIDRPAGVINVGGEVRLTQNVVDEEMTSQNGSSM